MDYLPDARFAINNHVNDSTGMTPFFADHGYHNRSGVEPPEPMEANAMGRAELLAADKISTRQKAMFKWLINNLTWAHDADDSRAPNPDYKVGNMVYVNTNDFSVDKQSRSMSFTQETIILETPKIVGLNAPCRDCRQIRRERSGVYDARQAAIGIMKWGWHYLIAD